MRTTISAVILMLHCALSGAAQEVVSKDDAIKAADKRNCFMGMVPVHIEQKLNENTFFGYAQYSVGDPFPIILRYITNYHKPISTGRIMIDGEVGVWITGNTQVKMNNGFVDSVSMATIGDKPCASLWAVINQDLLKRRNEMLLEMKKSHQIRDVP